MGEDKSFLEAFKGEVKWGDVVAPPVFEKKGGAWVKVGSRLVKVSSGWYGRPESHEIPAGARLVGVKCDNSWKLEDLSAFDPVNSRWDICKGWYYFERTNIQYVAD